MKKLSILFLAAILMITTSISTFGHSGRTDSSGGHKDNKNASGLGSYHYHHGDGPHLHTNGVCPYSSSASTSNGNRSTTNNSSTSSSSSTKTSTNATSSNTSTEVEKQKYIVIVEKTAIHEKASVSSDKLATAKEGYTFTPTGSTKSFWKMEFKKKDDDTVYTGYILKDDTEVKSN